MSSVFVYQNSSKHSLNKGFIFILVLDIMDLTHINSVIYQNVKYLYRRVNGEQLSRRRYILHQYFYVMNLRYIIQMWIVVLIVQQSKQFQIDPIELVSWGKYDLFLGFAVYHIPIDIPLIVSFSVFPLSAILEHLLIYKHIDKYIWSLLYDVINRNRRTFEMLNHQLNFSLPFNLMMNNPSKAVKSILKTFFILLGYISDSNDIYYSRLKLFPQLSIIKRKQLLAFVMFVEILCQWINIVSSKVKHFILFNFI